MAKLTDAERLARGLNALTSMPQWIGGGNVGSVLDGGPSFKIPDSGKLDQWHEVNGGVQACIGFPNGYEASVVRHSFSYGHEAGLWELAVRHGGRLVYDTPITDDVLGRLSDDAVTAALNEIAALPARSAP
jgi:hypothetical protein